MYDVINTQTSQNTEGLNTPTNQKNKMCDVVSSEPKMNCDMNTAPSIDNYENAETNPNQINYEEMEGYEEPVMIYLTCTA